jgi:DUF2934 family protein
VREIPEENANQPEPKIRANRLMIMTLAGTQTNILRNTYRATFQEYARKFDALQRLMGCGTSDRGRIEAALLDVEKARAAHSCARDELAKELTRPSLPPAARAEERHIRETAQLLWELAGRPDGTAERDWRRAEQLVQSSAATS